MDYWLLSVLEFSREARDGLQALGVKTVPELLALSDDELAGLPGFKRGKLREVCAARRRFKKVGYAVAPR